MPITPSQAMQVLEKADLLHDAATVNQAYDRMAIEITEKLSNSNPLVLSIMQGGLIPTGMLLSRLTFPLEIDYIHASRYNGATRGSTLEWRVKPSRALSGRTVLLIDDIHDEGLTLDAIVESCKKAGARAVYTAVLANKLHERKNNTSADFVGLDVVDRYVFGCGMDYKNYLRNLPAIYAVNEDG